MTLQAAITEAKNAVRHWESVAFLREFPEGNWKISTEALSNLAVHPDGTIVALNQHGQIALEKLALEKLAQAACSAPDEAEEVMCPACQKLLDPKSSRSCVMYLCEKCEAHYPPSLIKATYDDSFDYACGLRSGDVLYFSGAVIHGDYATLTLNRLRDAAGSHGLAARHEFQRGIDVRVSDIIWCADAPDGS